MLLDKRDIPVEIFKLLIDSELIEYNLYLHKDNTGNTFFNYACQYNEELAIYILNKGIVNKEILLIENKEGLIPLLTAIKYLPNVAKEIMDNINHDQEMINYCDYNKNTILMYCNKYYNLFIPHIINMKYFDPLILDNKNYEGYNTILHACRYSPNAIKFYLDKRLCKKSHLLDNIDYGLNITCRYQPEALNHLLQSYLMDNCLFNMGDNLNIAQTAARYNSKSFKYILDHLLQYSNKILAVCKMIDKTIEDYDDICNNIAPVIICKYQPEAVKYYLEYLSKNKDGFYESEIEGTFVYILDQEKVPIIRICFEHQPKSLMYLLKHYGIHILNSEYDNGYTIKDMIKIAYPLLLFDNCNVYEIEEHINLFKYTNDPVDNEDSDACNICNDFKDKIMFYPCKHRACVACALRLKSCHMCRELIVDKINTIDR
jgi:hypothetical protein